MTHDELLQVGAKWLNKDAPNIHYKSQLVCTELACSGSSEIPDILGLRPQGNILIEVKVSVEDFKRDFKKKCRNRESLQIGFKRFYLIPKGLVPLDQIPANWGLLEYDGSEIEISIDIPTKVRQCSALKYPIYSGAKYASKTGQVSPPWKGDVVQT